MGVFAEIAGELPAECLHDNLIFKYLINKKIEESTAKPTHEFYKFMNDIIPDIPPRRNLMYHMYVSESKETYCDLKFDDKHDYIYALYKMSQFDCYNVFSPLPPIVLQERRSVMQHLCKAFSLTLMISILM